VKCVPYLNGHVNLTIELMKIPVKIKPSQQIEDLLFVYGVHKVAAQFNLYINAMHRRLYNQRMIHGHTSICNSLQCEGFMMTYAIHRQLVCYWYISIPQ
jgi:hypothetical protein